MKMIKNILICFALVFSLNAEEVKQETNKVLAKIGDYKITQFQVNALVTAKLQKTFFHQNLSDEKKKELDSQALDELIERELLFLYAKNKKIIVDDKKIEEIKELIIKRFPSVEAFNKTLKVNNLSVETLKRDIEAEETMKLLYEKEIKSDYEETALLKYYEDNKYKFVKPESKSFQLILINIDPRLKDGEKLAKEKIEDIKTKLKAGEDFADLAQKFSHDMSRINGGKVGFAHKGTFKYLKEKDLNIELGALSEVIKTDIGFYLVKLLEIKPKEQLSFDAVKKNLKKELRTTNEKKKINKILKKQRKSLIIELF